MKRINFKDLRTIESLYASGLSQKEISIKTGYSEQSISKTLSSSSIKIYLEIKANILKLIKGMSDIRNAKNVSTSELQNLTNVLNSVEKRIDHIENRIKIVHLKTK